MRHTDTPLEFWCYAAEWAARVTSLVAHDLPVLRTRTPEEVVTGRTPDISEFAHYSWYDWVWYRDQASFPEPRILLGRWLGVAGDVGQAMTYWILTAKCTIIARSSVKQLQDYEKRDPLIIAQQERFTVHLPENRRRLTKSDGDSPFESVDLEELPLEEEAQVYTTPEMDEYTPDSYDEYLSALVTFPVGDQNLRGEVIRRRRDMNGRSIGVRHSNPILDTREYDVVFPDGTTQAYSANTIAENLYSQVDDEGRSFSLFDEIIDHKRDDTALSIGELSEDSPSYTTKGWSFLVSWKDGTSSYVPLREMKASFPLQTAEYVAAHSLTKEPAFLWCLTF
jgi:hypothetical protein